MEPLTARISNISDDDKIGATSCVDSSSSSPLGGDATTEEERSETTSASSSSTTTTTTTLNQGEEADDSNDDDEEEIQQQQKEDETKGGNIVNDDHDIPSSTSLTHQTAEIATGMEMEQENNARLDDETDSALEELEAIKDMLAAAERTTNDNEQEGDGMTDPTIRNETERGADETVAKNVEPEIADTTNNEDTESATAEQAQTLEDEEKEEADMTNDQTHNGGAQSIEVESETPDNAVGEEEEDMTDDKTDNGGGAENSAQVKRVEAMDNEVWDAWYKILVSFEKEHGHANPPPGLDFGGEKLGNWLQRQQEIYSAVIDGTVNADVASIQNQINLLDSIGCQWLEPAPADGRAWRYLYNLVLQYKAEHGVAPGHTRVYQGERLGQWLGNQKTYFQRKRNNNYCGDTTASLVREFLLNKIWNDATTERPASNHATTSPPRRTSARNVAKAVAVETDAKQMTWEDWYDVLVEFQKEHGHAIPSQKTVYRGAKLGQWCSNQRGHFKRQTRETSQSRTRAQLLNKIGFEFRDLKSAGTASGGPIGRPGDAAEENPRSLGRAAPSESTQDGVSSADSKSWSFWYDLLLQFKKHYGHACPTQSTIYKGERLGNWVHTQRAYYSKKRRGLKGKDTSASISREKLLNEIGFVWNCHDNSVRGSNTHVGPRDAIDEGVLQPSPKAMPGMDNPEGRNWSFWYSLLSDWKREHGRANPSINAVYKGEKIGQWCANQRSYYSRKRRGLEGKDTSTSLAREELLEKIGFNLNSHDTAVACGTPTLAAEAHSTTNTTTEKPWSFWYDLLVDYKSDHGHACPTFSTVYKGENLGHFVKAQRKYFARRRRSQAVTTITCRNREDLLNKIGFVWNCYEQDAVATLKCAPPVNSTGISAALVHPQDPEGVSKQSSNLPTRTTGTKNRAGTETLCDTAPSPQTQEVDEDPPHVHGHQDKPVMPPAGPSPAMLPNNGKREQIESRTSSSLPADTIKQAPSKCREVDARPKLSKHISLDSMDMTKLRPASEETGTGSACSSSESSRAMPDTDSQSDMTDSLTTGPTSGKSVHDHENLKFPMTDIDHEKGKLQAMIDDLSRQLLEKDDAFCKGQVAMANQIKQKDNKVQRLRLQIRQLEEEVEESNATHASELREVKREKRRLSEQLKEATRKRRRVDVEASHASPEMGSQEPQNKQQALEEQIAALVAENKRLVEERRNVEKENESLRQERSIDEAQTDAFTETKSRVSEKAATEVGQKRDKRERAATTSNETISELAEKTTSNLGRKRSRVEAEMNALKRELAETKDTLCKTKSQLSDTTTELVDGESRFHKRLKSIRDRLYRHFGPGILEAFETEEEAD